MTKQEYLDAVAKKQAQIDKLEQEIIELNKRFCSDNAPFKIGDKIMFKGKVGYITDTTFSTLGYYEYKWTPIKKDGTIGCKQNIYSFDAGLIEKVEE